METATTATSTSTSSTLRHRPVVGKANKEDGVPSTETEAAAAAAGSTSGTSKGMNGGSVAIKPPPRSPPTAGGPTRLGEGSEEEDDGVSGGTPSTTPPPPYDEDTAKSKLLALSRAFSSYPGEVIQTPVTGPAKIAMEDIYPNPNLVLQLLDFLILFIIVSRCVCVCACRLPWPWPWPWLAIYMYGVWDVGGTRVVFEDEAPHPIPADRLTHPPTQLATNKNA